MRASVKMRVMPFTEVTVPTEWHIITNVVLGDLDLNFQGQICETLIYRKR